MTPMITTMNDPYYYRASSLALSQLAQELPFAQESPPVVPGPCYTAPPCRFPGRVLARCQAVTGLRDPCAAV